MNSPLSHRQIILGPVFSEKSSKLAPLGKYTFKVEPSATKHQIKQALNDLYQVDVIKISTTSHKSSTQRSPRTGRYFNTSAVKKATVQLKKGQKLDLFTALEQ